MCVPFAFAAHPRSRGENEAGDEKGSTFEGSSPLTRGKRASVRASAAIGGLIPAHAGKTRLRPVPIGRFPAHPRSRGENLLLGTPTPVALGSSPLTRGKRIKGVFTGVWERLIPAHAGKTRR